MTTIIDPVEPDLGTQPLAPAPQRTFTPRVESEALPVAGLRRLGGMSGADALNIIGALVSALCTSLLLFGRIAPLSGGLGFVIVTYVEFLAAYALMLSFTESRPVVVDRIMSVVLMTAFGIAFLALSSVIFFVLFKGWAALHHLNFYTQDMANAGPNDPLTVGGIKHAIVGSLIIISIALVITLPLGIACAVFLTETQSKLARPVRTIVDAMTALPSIIAGLFIFATWILIFGFERSGFAAGIATSIMMLPIIIRASDVVLRLVPGNLREASAALGAPTWRTVWHVVLPTARPGLATAVILGVARGIGETAPVLLTSGVTASLNYDPVKNPMMSLPLAAFEFIRSPQDTMHARAYGTAAVLLTLVLGLFTIARILGGRPAGQITPRQARRRAERSKRDVARFDAIERVRVS